MSWTRTNLLVFLTLVAPTLPASARDVIIEAGESDGLDRSSNKQEAASNDRAQRESDSDQLPGPDGNSELPHPADSDAPRLILIEPQVDVWDASATRGGSDRSSADPDASAIDEIVGWTRCPCGDHDRLALNGRSPSTDRSWMISRYPNAPPARVS
jgi:hypothetical protein